MAFLDVARLAAALAGVRFAAAVLVGIRFAAVVFFRAVRVEVDVGFSRGVLAAVTPDARLFAVATFLAAAVRLGEALRALAVFRALRDRTTVLVLPLPSVIRFSSPCPSWRVSLSPRHAAG